MSRVLILVLLLAGCAASQPAEPPARPTFPLAWPAPEGFRKETIPFPLSFAPQLPYHGMEEIRFSPGFGDPKAPDYFTYCFVWLVESSAQLDDKALERDLTGYFGGLMRAVGKSDKFSTTVHSSGLVARVDTWDAFFTKEKLALTVKVTSPDSPTAARTQQRIYYFEASPNPDNELVRQRLELVRSKLEL